MKSLTTILLFLCPILFTYTLQAQSCDLSIPTVNICTDSSTGEIVVVNDGIDLSPPYIIEYIITDDAAGSQTGVPDAIISIGSMEDAQAAIDAAAAGESVYITAVVHNPEHLDQIRQDLDVCTNNLFTTLLGLTSPLQSWQQLYDGIIFFAGLNPHLTIADFETGLWVGANGGPSPGGTVEIEILTLGSNPPLLCDVSEYCYNVLPQTSVTIGSTDDIGECPTTPPPASCDIQAPAVSVCTDESTGETLIVQEDVNLSAPYIIEYIITDDATGSQTGVPNSIINIGSLEDTQAIIDAAAVGETVCITAIVHNAEQLDQIITDLNDCIDSAVVTLAPLYTLPISSWEEAYDQLTASNTGANPNLTLDELFAFTGNSGSGPGNGGMVDVGALAGLPPGLIVCTVPPYCYNVLPSTCMTLGDASNLCPTIGGGDVPTVSEWGLIILGLLTLITGLVSIRQREKPLRKTLFL